MRKVFTIALLVASLLYQGLVMAGNGLMYHSGEGIAHSLLHWEKAGHHHHDDGSVHEDESDESALHLHAESAPGAAALRFATPFIEPHRVTLSPAGAPVRPRAAPFLEGPTRPPRLTA